MRAKLSPWARQFSGGYERDAASLERSYDELTAAVQSSIALLMSAKATLETGRASALRAVKDALIDSTNVLNRAITSADLTQSTSGLRNLPTYYGPEHLYSQAHAKLADHARLLVRAKTLRSRMSRATIGSPDEVRAAIALALGEKETEVPRAAHERHCSQDAEGVRRALLEAKAQGAYGVAPGRDPGTPWVALRRAPGQPREEAPVLCSRDGRFSLGRWKKSERAHAEIRSLESARSAREDAWGIWDIQRERWMPDPLKMPADRTPARYASRGEAEKAADRNWRRHNPNDLFVVRGFEGARKASLPERARQTSSRRFHYGELPSWPAFEQAFHEELGEDGRYKMSLTGSDAKMLRRCGLSLGHREDFRVDDALDAPGLYRFLQCLARGWGRWSSRREAEEAGSLASSILQTLGFEWV